MRRSTVIGLFGLVILGAMGMLMAAPDEAARPAAVAGGALPAPPFQWTSGPPLQSPVDHPGMSCYSVKDPTIVRHGDRWHLFTTIRGTPRTHAIEYSSFADWAGAEKATRHVLKITEGYFCAPQVFYFEPHAKWYLIYQTAEPSRKPSLQPAFSTNAKIDDPAGWTKPTLLFDKHPESVSQWIDFWVICDADRAHLFFTSHDGKLWRSETKLAAFPRGWSMPAIVLKGDFFEACNIYALKGGGGYLALIEAIASGRRYFQAYSAEKLDGTWKPLAGSIQTPYAARSNVDFAGERWADSISHGELIRTGFDQRLEVDGAAPQYLYQGVTDEKMAGKPYGQIPWKLGLLTLKKK